MLGFEIEGAVAVCAKGATNEIAKVSLAEECKLPNFRGDEDFAVEARHSCKSKRQQLIAIILLTKFLERFEGGRSHAALIP